MGARLLSPCRLLLPTMAATSLFATTLLSCSQPEVASLRKEAVTSPYFDPGLAGSFFDFPWPSDLRIDAGGHMDLTGFPNPENIEILDLYVTTAETDIVGFGNNSPTYFRFHDDINVANLPELPGDGLELTSPVFLVNVDPDSPAFGERLPVSAEYLSQATMYSPSHLLGIAPMWGFPMLPSTTYAAVVLSSLEDSQGRPLLPPDAFHRIITGQSVSDPALEPLADQLEPLRDYLEQAGISADDVAIATTFTTQDPTAEMGKIHDWLHETQQVPTLDPGLETPIWFVAEDPDYEKVNVEESSLYPSTDPDPYDQKDSTSKDYWQFEGYYQGPNFQEGEAPYAEEGGAIRFDPEGNPIIQRWEPLRFCLAVPKGTPPAGGWPLAIFAHGTGGDYKNLLYSGTYTVAGMLIPRGIAVIGIDEPLHGERAPAGTDPELMSFNFFNPDAARSNFRQAAIDVFYLSWLAHTSLKVPAGISPSGQEIRFDPERVSFVGHSHGGLSGSLLVPFESDLRGSVLSGAGGGLSLTILLRKDYVDFSELFRAMLDMPSSDPLDAFHPVMALVQTLVDITDPINYSPMFFTRPIGGRAHNLLQTEGFYDEDTPPQTTEAMVSASRLPILLPLGRTIAGLEMQGIGPVSAPASNNLEGPDGVKVTAALAQFPQDNHFAIFRDYNAARLYADFEQSISYTDTAVLK